MLNIQNLKGKGCLRPEHGFILSPNALESCTSSWGDSEECGTGMWAHLQYVFLFGCNMSWSIMNGREPNLLSCPHNLLWGLLVSGPFLHHT